MKDESKKVEPAPAKAAEVPEYETKSIDVEVKRGAYVKYIAPSGNQYVKRREDAKAFEKEMGVDGTWIVK